MKTVRRVGRYTKYETTELLRMFEEGVIIDIEGGKLAVEAVSVCVHGDGPTALETAAHIKDGLIKAGLGMASLPDMLR